MIPVQESSSVEDLKMTPSYRVDSRTVANAKPSYNDLGISMDKPKKINLATKEARLKTFENFPVEHSLRAEDLAEAGFYFAGYDDCTRCFFCGGGLKNWDSNDDVVVEHARWFPKCSFIRQLKGHDFVDTVQKLNKRYDKITYNMVKESMGNLASVFNSASERELQQDPAIKALVELGFDSRVVLEAADYLHNENDTALSSDIILDRLHENHCDDCCHKISQPKNIQPASESQDTITDLKRGNQEMRQLTTCKICMDQSIAVVFLPCSHFVSCLNCSMALKHCPVCRSYIKGTIRAFMS